MTDGATFSPDALKVTVPHVSEDQHGHQTHFWRTYDVQTGELLTEGRTVRGENLRPIWSHDSDQMAFWHSPVPGTCFSMVAGSDGSARRVRSPSALPLSVFSVVTVWSMYERKRERWGC